MYYEIDGSPTEWNSCCKCGKSAKHALHSVLRFYDPARQPADPVDEFCREHYPAGPLAFDHRQHQSMMAAVTPRRFA